MQKLLLFDIDGTLIFSDGAGNLAFTRTLETLTGRSDLMEGVICAGKTDLQILGEALVRLGASTPVRLVNDFLGLYPEALGRALGEKQGHVKPGVGELLDMLVSESCIHVGILTGNVESGARIKLRHFGLDEYFTWGAYGSDERDRNLLVPVAIRRFQDFSGIAIEARRCLVIGDTPLDVQCARVHGAACIAVATGPYGFSSLLETGADLVVEDLSDSQALLRWIHEF